VVVASVGPFETLPVPSEVRQAVLESIYWREGDGHPVIDLQLRYHGRMVSGSLVGRPEHTQLYRDLFWALQRGLGRALAEIEDLEVSS
jgi:hypothetical protein